MLNYGIYGKGEISYAIRDVFFFFFYIVVKSSDEA